MRAYIIVMYILSFLYYKFGNGSILVMLMFYIFSVAPFVVKRLKNDVFDIGLIFVALYSLYITSIPIGMVTGNTIEYEMFALRYDVSLAYKVLYISGICPMLTFILLYYNNDPVNKSLEENVKELNSLEVKRSKIVSYFFILSGLVLYIFSIIKLGGLNYFKSSYVWNETSAQKGLMNGAFQLLSVGTIIDFYIYLKTLKTSEEKLNIFKWRTIYIIVPVIVLNFFQGSRLPTLMFFLGMILIYNSAYKKIPIRKVIPIAIVGVLLLGFWGYFRNLKSFKITEDAKKLMFGGSVNYELQYNSYTAMSVTKVIESVDKVNYLKGLTILDGITYSIPRMIFKSKDNYIFTNRWINDYNEETLIAPLGGLNLSAQLLMNGGLVFSLIFMIVFGFLLHKIYLNTFKIEDSKLFYSLFISQFMISFVRDPMYISIKYLIQFCIVPYIIYKLLPLIKVKN